MEAFMTLSLSKSKRKVSDFYEIITRLLQTPPAKMWYFSALCASARASFHRGKFTFEY